MATSESIKSGEQTASLMIGTSLSNTALNSLDFLIVQEMFMSETAKFANFVLPGASFFEKSGTFTNG